MSVIEFGFWVCDMGFGDVVFNDFIVNDIFG